MVSACISGAHDKVVAERPPHEARVKAPQQGLNVPEARPDTKTVSEVVDIFEIMSRQISCRRDCQQRQERPQAFRSSLVELLEEESFLHAAEASRRVKTPA